MPNDLNLFHTTEWSATSGEPGGPESAVAEQLDTGTVLALRADSGS